MTHDDDDDEPAPRWLAIAWDIHVRCAELLQSPKPRALRITTTRPSKRPIVDRLLWVKGWAPDTSTFAVQCPETVPAGARFAFPVGKNFGHTEIAHLRDCPYAKFLKIQVLELGEYVTATKQVMFTAAEVVAEFELG